jgi:GNAT superfamily N-acetyltransferase
LTVARLAFEETACSRPGDRVTAHEEAGQIIVKYSFAGLLSSPDKTSCVQFRVELTEGELWVGKLEIAAPFQAKGIGRELVRGIESVAQRLHVRAIRLYPLHGTEPFWRKMGYMADHGTARVLSKQLNAYPHCVPA